MFKSLFFRRLYLSFLLIVFAVALVVGLLAAHHLHESTLSQTKTLLSSTEVVVTDLLMGQLESGDIPALRQNVDRLAKQLNCRITVIDPNGKVLADNEANPETMVSHRSRPEVVSAFSKGQGWDTRLSETVHATLLYYARRIDLPNGQIVYLRMAIHLAELEQGLRALYWNIAIATGVCMVLAALVAYYITRRHAMPILEITQFADGIARGELDRRILRADRGELGILARSLNLMADSFARLLGEAQRDKAELQAVLTSMSEGIIATDTHRSILLVNEAAGRLLQFEVASSNGRAVWEVIRQEQILRALDEVAESGTRRQLLLTSQPGVQLEITAGPFDHVPGMPGRGLILIVRDVTQAMRYQELRKEFVANVSHELRTPLTVIKGFVETLRDGAIDDAIKREEYLATIERHTGQLGNLVSDLLELSKLENQPSVPRKTAVDLNGVVRRVLDLLHTQIQAKQHHVLPHLPPAAPPVVGNADYIERAIINLLDNAVKYTPAGGKIEITVGAEDSMAYVEIVDTGIGIPQEDLPRIFERFYRVDRSRSREMGGTGLGLAIVKHIAQVHGGRVDVTSELNGGSRFRLLLPLAVGM